MSQREMAGGFEHVNFIARLEPEEPGGYKAFWSAIETQIEAVSRGRRGDGICTCDLLIAVALDDVYELAGREVKLLDTANFKSKLMHLGREFFPFEQCGFQCNNSRLYDDA